MSTTPDGEVFGSGDPEQNEDITMYIESAGLSLRHASISYEDAQGNTFDHESCDDTRDGKYILRDCGSETGTWVRVGTTFAQSQNLQ